MQGSTSCDWKARDCGRAELRFVGALFSVLPTGLLRVHRRCVSINCAKFHSSQFGSVRVRFPRIAGSFSSVTATAPPTWGLAYWACGVLERYESTSHGTRESSLDSLLECMKAQIFSQTSSRFRSPSHTGPEEWIWPDYIPKVDGKVSTALLTLYNNFIGYLNLMIDATPVLSIVSENWPQNLRQSQ